MKKLTEDQLSLLKKPLPEEAVKQHPTKTFLSSIKAIYVTERFNDVFGVGAWSVKTELIKETEKGMVVVKVTFTVPEYGISYESFGGNDNGGENSKNFDLGDAYKGATTDALTKIGSYLGVGIDVFKGIQTQNNSPQKQEHQKEQNPIIKRQLTASEVKEKWNGKIYSNKYVYIGEQKIEPTTEQIEKLKLNEKFKQ